MLWIGGAVDRSSRLILNPIVDIPYFSRQDIISFSFSFVQYTRYDTIRQCYALYTYSPYSLKSWLKGEAITVDTAATEATIKKLPSLKSSPKPKCKLRFRLRSKRALRHRSRSRLKSWSRQRCLWRLLLLSKYKRRQWSKWLPSPLHHSLLQH